jgi:hypothetical protein
MTLSFVLTEAEQDLLDFARRVLGGSLAQFLLSGLGEPPRLRQRYTARSLRRGSTYTFEIVSETNDGLPAGRDPLVLASLLHLMWTRSAGRHEVVFRDEELLERLGWPETRETRLVLDAAVERYFCTAYYVKARGLPRAEGVESRYSHVRKLVTGYETTKERLLEAPRVVLKSTVVQFAAGFYEEVAGGEKYFFGIDFEQLELRELPQDSSE